ncbi:small lysine-rich protein 1 [Carassius gibelio]|uniref:small lysine-rich protein 1 n=1 Tax=Carassius gibelio TaxID=101364 RepID=UPI0022784E36|nr:small lysine-rich protein 1 [Carassius gibelio]
MGYKCIQASNYCVRGRHLIMPSGTKKSRSQSSKPAAKSKRKHSSKKRSVSAKSTKTEVDILSPAAMENVYYISHNAVDCLEFRGFGWTGATKKKGKKGKKQKIKK